ncbi:MAG TPA: class III extradiol ring-cleavage dioxygenase [Ferrovibrio sp.]
MTAQPALFVSHGSPLLPLEPQRPAHIFLHGAARHWPVPKAILAVSAQWETEAPEIGARAHPATIHDFHGIPPALHRMQYPAPGDPALAARIKALLAAAGFPAALDDERGLDHGLVAAVADLSEGGDSRAAWSAHSCSRSCLNMSPSASSPHCLRHSHCFVRHVLLPLLGCGSSSAPFSRCSSRAAHSASP